MRPLRNTPACLARSAWPIMRTTEAPAGEAEGRGAQVGDGREEGLAADLEVAALAHADEEVARRRLHAPSASPPAARDPAFRAAQEGAGQPESTDPSGTGGRQAAREHTHVFEHTIQAGLQAICSSAVCKGARARGGARGAGPARAVLFFAAAAHAHSSASASARHARAAAMLACCPPGQACSRRACDPSLARQCTRNKRSEPVMRTAHTICPMLAGPIRQATLLGHVCTRGTSALCRVRC
jgi:hypothetical protein